ncbi:unnamed protein product [Taenia asiatica]|uniref:MFS domain-containing protein n=1 Tax=Taenia asiatica TaxID=60517 RepID=A0A158R913_TAEAS|nr:unnamed protein product [Taenia asiatica]
MLYMLIYIPMIVPATWLLNHYGLRVSILIGAILNMLGAWIKCLSMELSQPAPSPASNASFPLLMVGQFVCALGQVFLLGVPAQLAATWFSKSELAMATAIGVFGNQVGCALGFGLPPLMVPAVTSSTGVENFGDFRKGFRIMFYGGAAIMTVDLIIVAIFFREEPKIAPSLAQYKRILQRRAQMTGDKPDEAEFDSAFDHENSSVLTAEETELVNQSYFRQVGHCFKCVSFILLNICYGESWMSRYTFPC